MAARATKLKAIPSNPDAALPPMRPLKGFYHGGGVVEGFGMARFYWPDGEGEQESIVPRIMKKRRLVAAGSEVAAAKVEPIPTSDAPQDYADVDFLINHYQASTTKDEALAFVQVTLRFGDCANVHHPYEVARAWAKSYYVDGQHLVPVISVLHAPYLSGSDADAHVHLIVLPRRLSRYGWIGRGIDLGTTGRKSRPAGIGRISSPAICARRSEARRAA
jgi:hypothetical protein